MVKLALYGVISYADSVKNMRAISIVAMSALLLAATMAYGNDRMLRVSVDMGFPPFEYVDETGKPAGFMVDVVNRIAQDQHVSILLVPAPPTASQAMLDEGSVDIRAAMYADAGPAAAGSVSTPLWHADYSVVVRRGSAIHDNAGIRNHSIATRSGDLAQAAAEGLGSRVVGFDDWTATLSAVIDGTVDCAIVPTIVGAHRLLLHENQDLRMIGPPLWYTTYRLEYRPADPALRDTIEHGLAAMRDSGDLDRIGLRWFSMQIPTGPAFLNGMVMAMLAAAIIIAAVTLAWALALRQQAARAPAPAAPIRPQGSEPLEPPHDEAGQAPDTQRPEPDLMAENTKLLACLCRELRTPLMGVSGALGLLKPAQLEPEQQQTLEMAMASMAQLAGIMDTLGDVVDAAHGSLRLQMGEFAYRQFAAQIDAEIREAAEIRGRTFRCVIQGEDQQIVSDQKRLAQAIRNLCNNAIEFTEHGEIDLALSLMPEGLHVVVRDTGPGLPEDARHEPFVVRYTDETGKPAAKLGLGLKLAKAIIDALHGTLRLTSGPGQGTEFVIEIPVAIGSMPLPEHIPALAEVAPVNRPVHHGRAIIAEDEAINRLYLKRILELAGYQVAQAANGAIALETALEGAWDFILMDVSMPKMDGLEATRRIRAHQAAQEAPHIPIIALTAHAYAEDRQACAQAGMDGFLSKPFTEMALWAEIQRVLGLIEADRSSGQAAL